MKKFKVTFTKELIAYLDEHRASIVPGSSIVLVNGTPPPPEDPNNPPGTGIGDPTQPPKGPGH